MQSLETLKRQAREGDLNALQCLREMGFFKKNGSGQTPRTLPLSAHQQRLWFIDLFEAGVLYESSPVYHNIPLLLQLEGHVDADILQNGLNAIINRHEPLHTRIITENNQGFQRLNPDECLELRRIELPELREKSLAQLRELGLREATRPFVLSRDLLIRAVLIRGDETRSLLVITVHHLIADRCSMRIIAEELAEFYRARKEGRSSQLATVSRQYGDYVEWRKALPAEVMEPLLFYWKRQLGGRLQALELPESRLRPAVHTFTGGCCTMTLDRGLAKRIREFSERRQIDVFTILLCGFKLMLQRYSQFDEIIVGTTVPCRNQPGIAGAVGPFANLLVLRSRLAPERTVGEFLDDLAETTGQARKHEELSWDTLVEELDPWRDMSRIALMDVLFQFENDPLLAMPMADVTARVIETNFGFGKYDLNFYVFDDSEGMSGVLAYNTDIYNEWLMAQMLRHFKVVLDILITDPGTLIKDIKLLGPHELKQQFDEWNRTEREYPKGRSIVELFEAQARRTPENVAVVCGLEGLMYGELNGRANQLGRYLRKLGVGPEVMVGICMERSLELVVGALGVMKAGGAYVPIDPDLPMERIGYILQDTGVAVLLIHKSVEQRVPAILGHVICVDGELEVTGQQSRGNIESQSRPENLAYVIYTSGSTGQPKGVGITQRGLLNLVRWQCEEYGIGEQDRATQLAGVGFDASVWEVWPYLAVGASLYIPGEEIRGEPEKLRDWLVAERITMSFVPTP